jgi:hypothetical protein
MDNNLKIRNAVLVGIVPAILEGLLIYFADPETSNWVLVQSILFWFSCGFVVYLIDIGPKKILSSILLTVFLNIPWFIALSVVASKPDHLMPLVVASVIMGTIIGFVSSRLNRRIKKTN